MQHRRNYNSKNLFFIPASTSVEKILRRNRIWDTPQKINSQRIYLVLLRAGIVKIKPGRWIVIPALLLLLLGTSCVDHGDLRYNPLPSGEYYTLAGNISLPELVESDLFLSIRPLSTAIGAVTDFSKFAVSVPNIGVYAGKSGAFSVSKVPYSTDLVLTAKSGRVVLLKRLYPTDLRMTDVTQLTINLESTAKALIWQSAHGKGIELTESDITAREFEQYLATLTTALKFALQLPQKDVPKTILDLSMVTQPTTAAVNVMEAREAVLREAYSVLENIILREDEQMLEYYISPDFTNDWDSTSGWSDFITTMKDNFKKYDFQAASYTIHQLEFIPGNTARIRTSCELSYTNSFSGLAGKTGIYTTDLLWRKEGNFWKIYRNLPYKSGHPAQLGADSRWGEIARAHADLQTALFREDLPALQGLISESFGNDWDVNSTWDDILLTARSRFNTTDVKIATYTIRNIDFIGVELAKVHCSAEVRVIKLFPGIDVDSGPINAVVDWRLENGTWRIFRNLPYRFKHPTNIQ